MRKHPVIDRSRFVTAAAAIELLSLGRSLRRDFTAVQAEQMVLLNWMVRHARANAPFFRDLYADIPERIDEIGLLPFIDKQMLLARAPEDSLTAPVSDGVRTVFTSGTSGFRLKVETPPGAALWQGALAMRTQVVRGVRPWERTARVGGTADHRTKRGLHRAATSRRIQIEFAAPTEETVQILAEWDPVMLSGNVHGIIAIGEAAAGRLRPRVIGAGGDEMSPDNRACVLELFGVTPFDTYGSYETGELAWQCTAADLYHINHEAVIFEVLGDDGRPAREGDSGDVVLTTLWNPLMPLIRYRIGDRATFADRPCACGSTRPALLSIDGRAYDWFVDDRGARVNPHRFWPSYMIPGTSNGIKRFRVHQDARGHVVYELVVDDRFPREAAEVLRAGVSEVLGPGIPVSVRFADALHLEPSGKYRMFSSERVPS